MLARARLTVAFLVVSIGAGIFVVPRTPTVVPPTDAAPRLARDEKPFRGPELIERFFADWHAPEPADLSPERLQRLWSEVRARPRSAAKSTSGPWECKGPFGMFTSPGRQCGRVRDLDVGPEGIRRLAAASGGAWALDGFQWQPISDALDTQWIGSIDSSPSDPDLVLVGTGEPWIRAGTGLWRSADGGATWSRRALPANPATCFRVRFQPDGQRVIGAFDLGIYRSVDAGLTWSRTALPHWPTDLALHPSDPDVLWAPVYENGLYRSDDGGATWSPIGGVGLPSSGNGRGAVSVCASDPDRLYVAFATPSASMLGVFRSDDGGATWTDVSPPDDYFWGQGWYNNTIGVSPVDPDLVLAGGGALLRSDDAGLTWTTTATGHVHVDNHAIEWTPSGSDLYVATDGGYSHSTDGGVTWSSALNRLPITQYVTIDVGDQIPLAMGGGSQDNGLSISVDGGATWRVALGGDGGGLTIDDNDDARVWGTLGLYGGSLLFRCLRSLNGGSSWLDINDGIQASGAAFTRIRSDHAEPPTIYTNNGPWVYRANARGDLWTPVNAVAFEAGVRELTVKRTSDGATLLYACLDSTTPGRRVRVFEDGVWEERSTGLAPGVVVRKVVPHPTDDDRCFALMNGLGVSGQKIFRSDDRGRTWLDVTGDLPDVPVSDLVAHPTRDGRWYVGSEFGAFRTVDGGATWERWNDGMPEANVMTEMTLVDLRDETGELFVAAGSYGRGLWMRPIAATSTSVEGVSAAGLRFAAPRPEPARSATTLTFAVDRSTHVRMRLFDVRGRRVRTLVDEVHDVGHHEVVVPVAGLAPGVYFARVEADGATLSRRVTVVR